MIEEEGPLEQREERDDQQGQTILEAPIEPKNTTPTAANNQKIVNDPSIYSKKDVLGSRVSKKTCGCGCSIF